MRLASLVNQYVSDEAPWATIESDRPRAGTVLHVSLRCVDDLKTMLAPFLPFSSQTVHELLGYAGALAGPIDERVREEQGGPAHAVLTGDYVSWVGRWEPGSLPPGQTLREPRPLFRKLDPERVVADELGRMEAAAAPA
jgi:methionyl-tRNA synthetase